MLLVVGVPVALLTTGLQTGLSQEDPHFSARYALDSGDDSGAAVLPRVVAPADIPASVRSCATSRPWVHRQGGMDIGTSLIDIEAVGARDRTVAIRNIRAEIVGSPREPETGTVIDCRHQGEGDPLDIGIDLDSPTPVALTGYGVGAVSYAPYFRDKFRYLENQKPEVFNLTALASEHGYDYVIKIDGSVDGKNTTWTLRDGDKPFRISGVRKDYSNVLANTPVGWQTDYVTGSIVAPLRCTADCWSADGRTATSPPGAVLPTAAPSSPPPAPKRPSEAVPPLTVNDRDPESVAIAWAVTNHSYDFTRDRGPVDVLARTAAYMTPQLRAEQAAQLAEPPDNPLPEGPNEVPAGVAHGGWSEVRYASVWPDTTGPGGTRPDALDAPQVRLDVKVFADVLSEDGWREHPPSDRLSDQSETDWRVTVARQPDGTYRLATIEPR